MCSLKSKFLVSAKVLTVLLLVFSILVTTASCGKEKKKNTTTSKNEASSVQSSEDSVSSEDGTVSDEEGTASSDDSYGYEDYEELLPEPSVEEVEYRLPREYDYNNPIMEYGPVKKVLYVEDFGAKGDGVTDDGEAIFKAISELIEIGKDAKLVFGKNKTYRYAYEEIYEYYRYLFKISDCVNCHIVGDNTTIISASKKPREFITFNNTAGCSVTGFNFDFAIRPYFMAENATELDTENLTCVMKIGSGMAKNYLGLTEIGQQAVVTVNGNNGTPFGIIEADKGRQHMFLYKYELVGKDKIKIYFIKDASPYTASWMNDLKTKRLICPTPGVGHAIEYAMYLGGNTNLTFKDINIYSAAKFVNITNLAEGVCTYDNVNFIPNPALKGTFEETDFMSWRDGWHMTNNRAKFRWINCSASGLQDDIFNVSCHIMNIAEVQSANRVNMYYSLTGGTFPALKRGDKITILDSDRGIVLAQTEISRVVSQSGKDNIVTLKDSFANMPSGDNIIVLFEDFVAAGSEITNCYFNGTVRLRGEITVKDTIFDTQRMYLDILNWIEGPVPRNMLFKNCEFIFDSDTEKYMHISSYNTSAHKDAFHIKNIVFEDCILNRNNLDIGVGDEVKFINCRTK